MKRIDDESLQDSPTDGSAVETPEIYALERTGAGWNLSRRGFLGAAGTTFVGASVSAGRAIADGNLADDASKITLLKACESARAHMGSVYALAISADGKLLASSGSDNTIKLWLLPDGELYATLSGHTSSISALVISPDGKLLASGSSDRTIKLWTLSKGALLATLSGHTGSIGTIAISPNGKLLASGSSASDDGIKLWSLPEGELLVTFNWNNENVMALGFSSDGKLLASSVGWTIKLWSITDELVRPGGKGPSGLVDSFLRWWSLPNGALRATISGHNTGNYKSTSLFAISPSSKLLASWGGDKTVRLWTLPEGTLRTILRGHTKPIEALAFSPDGTLLASGSSDETVKIWSLPEGSLHATLNRNTDGVDALAISPDGKLLISGGSSRNTINLWSLPDGSHLANLRGHTKGVGKLAITPDGKLLVSGSYDNTIKLWTLPEGRLKTCLIDLDASNSDAKGMKYTMKDEHGQMVTYTLPCGSAIPAGAICACNCVAGSIPAASRGTRSGSGSGSGSYCTCASVSYYYPN